MSKKDKHKHHHHHTTEEYFGQLAEGTHFYFGGDEYVKTVTVPQGVSVEFPSGLSFINVIRIRDGQVSGFGKLVAIELQKKYAA
jgi:hypothetical protein